MYSAGVEDENDLRGIAKTSSSGTAFFTTIFPGCYAGSTSNLAQLSPATDNVFSDDRAIHQLATVTGSVAKGHVANLTSGV